MRVQKVSGALEILWGVLCNWWWIGGRMEIVLGYFSVGSGGRQ